MNELMRRALRHAVALSLVLTGASACGGDEDAPADSTPDTGEVDDTGETPSDDTGASPGEDATADTTTPTSCVYPAPLGGEYGVGYAKTIPDIYWEPAYRADGTSFRFDLFEFYCSPEYAAYDTLVVVVSAGWCPQCPRMIDWVDRLAPRLEQEGAFILYLEAQNDNGAEASSEVARNHFARHTTTNQSGVRVGDANAVPRNAIAASSLLRAFPTTFVVRKRDMQMIVESSMSNFILPFVEIAMDPEADWSRPPQPTIQPTYPSNCGEEDEEPFEPNNTPAEAGPLAPGDVIEGGICDIEPDFYRIDFEGDWRLRLEFDGREADLDVYVWDVERDRPAAGPTGSPIGSFTYESVEEFEHSGPAVIYIHGFQNATTTYTLSLVSR